MADALKSWLEGETAEAWAEYIDQRRKDKKPMTERSMRGRLTRLQALKDAGHDPLRCLDEAINMHWLDFYEPKEKPITKINGNADRTWFAQQDEALTRSRTPEAMAAAAKVRQLFKR